MQIILFTEGDTDKEFYSLLLDFYKKKSKSTINSCKIYNLKGIGRFENKVYLKLKNEIIPKYKGEKLSIVFCYDADVFELGIKPPTDWKLVRNKLAELNLNDIIEVKATSMIEDWFLLDIENLCKYLRIKQPSKLEGRKGFEKMKFLFKRGGKVYQKGSDCHKFLSKLDINSIRDKIKIHLVDLERKINYQNPSIIKNKRKR